MFDLIGYAMKKNGEIGHSKESSGTMRFLSFDFGELKENTGSETLGMVSYTGKLEDIDLAIDTGPYAFYVIADLPSIGHDIFTPYSFISDFTSDGPYHHAYGWVTRFWGESIDCCRITLEYNDTEKSISISIGHSKKDFVDASLL